jgi:uncharacterized membrane protein
MDKRREKIFKYLLIIGIIIFIVLISLIINPLITIYPKVHSNCFGGMAVPRPE